MRKFLRTTAFSLLVMFIMASVYPAVGQDQFTPYQQIIMLCVDRDQTDLLRYSDICTWTPGEDNIVRETTGLHATDLRVAPDGSHAVYRFLPDFYAEAYQEGEDLTGGMGPLPHSIGVMDLTVSPSDPGRFTIIANQDNWTPESDTILQRRSVPKWSPDSTRLAWIELDTAFEGHGGRIMIYDVQTGVTEIVATRVNLGYGDAGMWGIPNIIGWSSVIAHTSVNAGVYPDDSPGGSFGTLLDVYDLEGNLSRTAIEYFAEFEDSLNGTVWLLHRDGWQLGLHYTQTGWIIFDPVEQIYEALKSPPVIQAITGEGWIGHIVEYGRSQSTQVDWEHEEYTAADAPSWLPHTFDSEGNPVWISAEGELQVLRQGTIETIDLPEQDGMRVVSAVWTPYVWLTDGVGTLTEPAVTPQTE